MTDRVQARRSTDGLSTLQLGLFWLLALLFLGLAFFVVQEEPYSPQGGFGYVLGIIGGVLMLVLFIYPLRKRLTLLQEAGTLPSWFQIHMICGVLGPVLILFHATFEVKSINAAVAVTCMLLVAISGLVGRFLYRRIHYGLYGRLTTAEDMQKGLQASLNDLSSRIGAFPELQQLVDEFGARVNRPLDRFWLRFFHFVSLGWYRHRTLRAVRSLLGNIRLDATSSSIDSSLELSSEELKSLVNKVERTCGAMQRAAQFSTYERLFALWHLAHVPFVYLFVLTAIAHVVAVHIY